MDGPEEYWDLPNDLEAVGKCRHIVTDTLTEWGIRRNVVDDMVLVVDELYANAIRHVDSPIDRGKPAIGLRLRLSGRCLGGEVVDLGPTWVPRPRDPESVGGRGLEIVAALVDAWGVDPGQVGKAVWFKKVLTETDLPGAGRPHRVLDLVPLSGPGAKRPRRTPPPFGAPPGTPT